MCIKRSDFDLTNRSDFDPTIELNFVVINGTNLYLINNIAIIINLSYPSICMAKARWQWFWCEKNIHYSYAITITQRQSSHQCHTSRHMPLQGKSSFAGFTLKWKVGNFHEVFISGCIESCQFVNVRCNQWRKICWKDISPAAYTEYIPWNTHMV